MKYVKEIQRGKNNQKSNIKKMETGVLEIWEKEIRKELGKKNVQTGENH